MKDEQSKPKAEMIDVGERLNELVNELDEKRNGSGPLSIGRPEDDK